MAVPLDRIPDSLGYLILAEDGAVINILDGGGKDILARIACPPGVNISQPGYVAPHPGAEVLESGGELENAEQLAAKFTQIVYDATRVPLSSNKRETFKKISVIWESSMYIITVSNHKIFISKRRYIPSEPVSA